MATLSVSPGAERCEPRAQQGHTRAHRKRMRTSNGIERPIQQELKRRTSKVRVFPNVDSLERLSTAVLVEIDEKWETETKAYIKWEELDE